MDALGKFHELTAKLDERRRGLAAAMLNAQHKVQDSERERDRLSRQLQEEQKQLAAAERARRLALSSTLLGATLASLLGYLLWMSRRHARILRRQELTLRTMAENSPDALFLIDATGTVLFASRTLASVTSANPINQQLAEIFPADVRDLVSAAVRQLLIDRQPTENELRISIADHDRRFELLGRPLLENGSVLGATLRLSDVTDIRATERKVLDIVSRERQRVSSDLHEGLGQELTGIALQLGAITAAVRSGKGVELEQLGALSQQVDRSIGVTRNLARGFSPMRTDSGSLSASLASLAVEASRRLRISVSSRSMPADITVPDDTGEHLYSIAYEAVTNAARHGQVKSVVIDLQLLSDRVVLTVTDDGVGIPGDAPNGDGWGIRMMRYRARLLGATLDIGPAHPGPGTKVSIAVSVRPIDQTT